MGGWRGGRVRENNVGTVLEIGDMNNFNKENSHFNQGVQRKSGSHAKWPAGLTSRVQGFPCRRARGSVHVEEGSHCPGGHGLLIQWVGEEGQGKNFEQLVKSASLSPLVDEGAFRRAASRR